MATETALIPISDKSPQEVVENATVQAKLLMDIVEKTKCFQEIAGKKYLQVEAWETIGAFNRVHAETENITPIVANGETIGYQARVQLWRDGVVVGGAIMPCYFTENCCKGKEGDAKHKTCMSAAQTFATSKAYRMNYSYVAILAGYQPTPAEEMTSEESTSKTAEHWCSKHKTAFFKKGKMKSYAHPIGDSGEWCHEHTEDKPANVAKVDNGKASTPQSTSMPWPEQSAPSQPEVKPKRDSTTIKNFGDLYSACMQDWPDDFKTKQDILKELGVNSQTDLSDTPAECYQKIAAVRQVEP